MSCMDQSLSYSVFLVSPETISDTLIVFLKPGHLGLLYFIYALYNIS